MTQKETAKDPERDESASVRGHARGMSIGSQRVFIPYEEYLQLKGTEKLYNELIKQMETAKNPK